MEQVRIFYGYISTWKDVMKTIINITFTSTHPLHLYTDNHYIPHESVIVLPSSGWLEAWSSYTDVLHWEEFYCFLEWHFIDFNSLPQDFYSITSRAWFFLNSVYNGINSDSKINEFTAINNYSLSWETEVFLASCLKWMVK